MDRKYIIITSYLSMISKNLVNVVDMADPLSSIIKLQSNDIIRICTNIDYISLTADHFDTKGFPDLVIITIELFSDL